ncbi:hypothetical protein OWV82_024187 [Melia azedarach]|uniref:Uncharacterized protein n=1 Tax=Melia azedarach TaxID=155640 RepID=A0ACC1WNZ6_MELAZ|nr:hypothetical protein OWV82_024187 [Melia azedarach]
MGSQQPASNFPVGTETKNLTTEEINSARAKEAMQVYIIWKKEAAAAAAAAQRSGGNSIPGVAEQNEIELIMKNLKV